MIMLSNFIILFCELILFQTKNFACLQRFGTLPQINFTLYIHFTSAHVYFVLFMLLMTLL